MISSRRMHFGHRRRLLVIPVLAAMVAASCGGGDDDNEASQSAEVTEQAPATSAPTAEETSSEQAPATTAAPAEESSSSSEGPIVETLPPETVPEPVKGGTLRYGLEADVDGLNPTTSALSAPGLMMANAVFDTLTATTADNKVVPFLAQSVEPATDDFKSWTLTLRPNITFQDGTPLNADAIMKMPYTKSLMRSIPKIEDTSHTRLMAIPGRPPDLVNPPPGCRFAPRCAYARDKCRHQEPPLTPAAGADHVFACWYPVESPEFEERDAEIVTQLTIGAGSR